MPKVIIDTNVFISGLLYGGIPRKILDLWQSQKVIFCTSPKLNAEIIVKLKHKFNYPSNSLTTIDYLLNNSTQQYLPQSKISICADPTDNFLLELAVEANADFLISGDKKVQDLKTIGNTKIVSPTEFTILVSKLFF